MAKNNEHVDIETFNGSLDTAACRQFDIDLTNEGGCSAVVFMLIALFKEVGASKPDADAWFREKRAGLYGDLKRCHGAEADGEKLRVGLEMVDVVTRSAWAAVLRQREAALATG